MTTTAHKYVGLRINKGPIDETRHPGGPGPMFMHKNSKQTDLNPFFAHLSLALALDAKKYKYNIGQLLIGSDGERKIAHNSTFIGPPLVNGRPQIYAYLLK